MDEEEDEDIEEWQKKKDADDLVLLMIYETGLIILILGMAFGMILREWL